MRGVMGKVIAAAGVAGLLVISACGNSDNNNSSSNSGGSGDKKVQVFTWWADGGEKAGLDGLVSQFQKDCSQYEFDNAAVAGGAGANAKQVLAQNLRQNNPPSTFQAHAGKEIKDYINAGQVDDVSSLYDEFGLKT